MFPYKTELIVQIKDYIIGIFYYMLALGAWLYILLYVFMHKRSYELTEHSAGYIYYNLEGKAYSENSDGSVTIWDEGDLFYPE